MQSLQRLGMLFPQSKNTLLFLERFSYAVLTIGICLFHLMLRSAYSNHYISCPGLDLPYYIWESTTHVSFCMQNIVIIRS